MTKRSIFILIFLCLNLSSVRAQDEGLPNRLAAELFHDGDYEAAAIEYRRLAMMAPDKDQKAGFYLAGAYSYLIQDNYELAYKLLDQAEELSSEITFPALLLRGETAFLDRQYDEAVFYFESALSQAEDKKNTDFIKKRLLKIRLDEKKYDEAETIYLSLSGTQDDYAVLKLQKDKKSPKVGGWLGVLPGLGYLYSKEYANALRSFILNGIFIFGMVDSADKDNWGAFGVITFFEITWYTGSIYGGIDAAYRYNNDRLKRFMDDIGGNRNININLDKVPVIGIQFDF